MVEKTLLLASFVAIVLSMCDALPSAIPEGSMQFKSASIKRSRRAGNLEDIPDTQRDCTDPDNPKYPATTILTTERVAALRVEMEKINALAYIVPSEDSHNSEYIASCHKRRPWISGLTGSAGLAIVTHNESAVWTDGRYFLQAEQQLDCGWILMRSGETGTPSQSEWLIDVLPSGTAGDPSKVAFDPTLLSLSTYNSYKDAFEKSGKHIEMYPHEDNLIDIVWTTDRPPCTNEPLMIMDIQWTGQEWWDKVTEVRGKMEEASTDMMVLHALDDTAWFFNLRGADIPYNPVFFAYTIIKKDKTILYIKSVDKLVTNVADVKEHLKQNDQTSVCASAENNNQCLDILEYDDFLDELKTQASGSGINKVWISDSASYGIYDSVDEDKHYAEAVPIRIMKAVKNENEIAGMKEGNIQDAIAKIEFLHWMENAIKNGQYVTELSADAKLVSFRQEQPDFVMPSFGSISAFGPNGAVIHYTSTNETNVQITADDMYLLDSGGQYKCGTTTDTTRTMHFGTPKEAHKQAYTRVMLGAIDLSLCIFPEGTYGRDIDVHARQHLWNHGWNYRHGTGHGLGAMLNVHEGPHRISIGYRPGQAPLEYGMFSSDEPGYYEDNDFGVRLETVFMVVQADTPNNFGDLKYFTFEEVAFVPFEPKLIMYEIMSPEELNWLNDYHQKVREKVGPRLKEKNEDAYDWMIRQTEAVPVPYDSPTDSAQTIFANVILLVTVTVVSIFTSMN
ncbi:xaa-Pro aminopeptidase 1-like isoform X1 [Ptychodera flava]|uniref:xaa-Pro aminopeptidase 1-like isoform X1 n=1 Tax=Ptychodera flava TaxID=63121 RepID=UPI00396A85DD